MRIQWDPIRSHALPDKHNESTFKTAVAAGAMKPEFDAWLNQKKLQVQMDSQASLFKLTQTDLSNTISPAITQITDTVKEVQEIAKASSTNQASKRHSQTLSDGEEIESPVNPPQERNRSQETTGRKLKTQI